MGHDIQTPCQKSGRHDHTDIRMLCMIPAAKFPDHHKRHDDQKTLRKHTNNTADDQKDHQRYSRDDKTINCVFVQFFIVRRNGMIVNQPVR